MAWLTIIKWYGEPHQERATYFGAPYVPAVGTAFDLPGGTIRVGRAPDNDLILPVKEVSRYHFRLVAEEGHYVYENIDSRQIPIYNEQPFPFRSRRVIQQGDTFNAAGIFFRFSQESMT